MTRPFSVLVLALSSACAQGTGGERIRLADGSNVDRFRIPDSSVAVVLLKPSTCFSCTAGVREWLALRVAYPSRVRVILTSQPDTGERRALRLRRFTEDGILAREPPDELSDAVVLLASDGMQRIVALRDVMKTAAVLNLAQR